MKFLSANARSLIRMTDTGDSAFIIGIAGGRQPYDPEARWIHSFRVFLFVVKLEILWSTGKGK